MTAPVDHLKKYAQAVERELGSGRAGEHSYRPPLKTLLESLASPEIQAINEPTREACGAPDFIVQRGTVPLGYIGHATEKDVLRAYEFRGGRLMGVNIPAAALLGIALTVAVGSWLALPDSVAGQTPKTINRATLEERNQKTSEVSTEELRSILADRSAIVFDARPPREYAISHIPGALNVRGKPGLSMSQYVPDAAEIERALGGKTGSPIVLYCSGPFCGRSKRLSEELLSIGFTNVRRYQLGIPVWRALGGATQIEGEAVGYVHAMDRSAVFIDTRDPEQLREGTLARAVSVPATGLEHGKDVGEIRRGEDDGRLPMEDHNTRVIVFGRDGAQARAVAEAIIGEAFHNVAFYDGSFESLRAQVK